MINFEEELKKFHPSLEVGDVEDAIYNQDVTDLADVLVKLVREKEVKESKEIKAAKEELREQKNVLL